MRYDPGLHSQNQSPQNSLQSFFFFCDRLPLSISDISVLIDFYLLFSCSLSIASNFSCIYWSISITKQGNICFETHFISPARVFFHLFCSLHLLVAIIQLSYGKFPLQDALQIYIFCVYMNFYISAFSLNSAEFIKYNLFFPSQVPVFSDCQIMLSLKHTK